MNNPNSQVTEQARELLAREYESEGRASVAEAIRAGEHDEFDNMAFRAIEAALTARTEAPSNLGEFVIALLIAGGYVTQDKADEARKIALSTGPYEMPALPAAEEGFVVVPVEPTEAMLSAGLRAEAFKRDEIHAYDDAATVYAAMLAARPQPAQGDAGDVGRG